MVLVRLVIHGAASVGGSVDAAAHGDGGDGGDVFFEWCI